MKKRILKKFDNDKNYQKFRDHCYFRGKYRSATHIIYNLKFNVPSEIPVVFLNGSNFDYHFLIKELENKFERQFECLGEKTENYKSFSVPVDKEVINIDKDGNESVVTLSYKTKFIYSARCMASLLSIVVDNLAEELDKIKCRDCDCFHEYESAKDNLIK